MYHSLSIKWIYLGSFFFFQAEDGIRDYKVTGVQTCALPISHEVGWFHDHIEAGVTYANRPQGATTGAWPGYQAFGGWKGSGSTGKAIASFYRSEERRVGEECRSRGSPDY